MPENVKSDNADFCNPKSVNYILTILSKHYTETSSGVPSIVKFVEQIVNDLENKNSIDNDLVNWLNQLAARLKISIFTDSDKKNDEVKYDSRLVCVISPEDKRFCLKFIYIEDETIKSIDYLIQESQNEVRKGIICSSIDEISIKINDMIKEFLENINDFLEIIEIYLPYQLLYLNVDNWQILDALDENFVLLLDEYKVIIHATDRAKPGKVFSHLHDGWGRLENILKKESNTDIYNYIEISDNKSNWKVISDNLKQKIGIKLIEPLLKEKIDNFDFIKAILKGGVPLAFWVKCEPCGNIDLGKIDSYLTVEYLEKNLDKLIKDICTVRRKAYNEKQYEDIAYHLGFWCDIPDKIRKIRPLVFKQLNFKNQ